MPSSHDPVLTVVEGGNALTPFRAEGLLARLAEAAPGVRGGTARHVHWVASQAPLDEEAHDKVTRLLTYGEPWAVTGTSPEGESALVVVGPRLGTVSPWASKATDIAHNCGLSLHRV